jgi:hypothetical protein
MANRQWRVPIAPLAKREMDIIEEYSKENSKLSKLWETDADKAVIYIQIGLDITFAELRS